MSDDRETRRTCADRARYAAERRKVQRGKKFDPAMSMTIQFLGLLSVGLRLLPEFSIKSRPVPAVSIPAPPVRPPDSDQPWQRYKSTPSWQRVVKDLARPAATADAQQEVRSRLPVECAPWLNYVFRENQWGDLRILVRSGSTDVDVAAEAVAAARLWDSERRAARARAEAELRAEEGGASTGAKPGEGTGWERKPR